MEDGTMGVEAILVVVKMCNYFKIKNFPCSQIEEEEEEKSSYKLMAKSDQISVVCNDVKFYFDVNYFPFLFFVCFFCFF